MAEQKTAPTSVNEFIDTVGHERRRADARRLAAMMAEASGEPAVMWGRSIVGFGRYRYRYDSGRTGESFLVGFSPRKSNLVLYIMPGFSEYAGLLSRLGKHRTGKACLYINKLADVDEPVLKELIGASVAAMQKMHGAAAG